MSTRCTRALRASVRRSIFQTVTARAFWDRRGDLSLRLVRAGHEVRVFVSDYFFCFIHSAARVSSSAGGTSSICVAMAQLFPQGSVSLQLRSP